MDEGEQEGQERRAGRGFGTRGYHVVEGETTCERENLTSYMTYYHANLSCIMIYAATETRNWVARWGYLCIN